MAAGTICSLAEAKEIDRYPAGFIGCSVTGQLAWSLTWRGTLGQRPLQFTRLRICMTRIA